MNLPPKYDFIEMHDDLEKALDVLQHTNDNMFIIGPGGSGKSLFIQLITDKTIYNRNTVVCCPTGIAAVNASTEGVKATTIHSLFQLPPLSIIPANKLECKSHLSDMMNAIHTLVIDEISMVNSDLLTKVMYLLGEYRQQRPVRLIMLGDPSQLSPVVRGKDEKDFLFDTYGSQFFFDSAVFKDMKVVKFDKIFRQKDMVFKETLNRFRFGKQTVDDLQYINSRVMDVDEFRKDGDFVHIALTNRTVNTINSREIALNKNMAKTYRGENLYYPDKELPVPEFLELKLDTQVMIVANNSAENYYNGLLGRITKLDNDSVEVTTVNGTHTIKAYTWQRYNYKYNRSEKSIEAKVSGQYKQLPVKVAYALTAHKTQGLTLDRAYIDFEKGTFASGQAYVALSRIKTLEGMGLARKVQKKDNKISPLVKKFYKKYKIA